MPTIVDSLIVQLNLDPSDFTKGQKAAAAEWLKTRDAAKRGAKETEKAAKDMQEALGKATKSIFDLSAAFLGGRGFKEFIDNARESNTALGNLASSLGASPQLITAWDVAAARAGGTAGATQASLKNLSDQLVDLRTQGKNLPDALWQLSAKSGVSVDIAHGWNEMAISLAAAANQLAKTDPAAANRLLQQLGLDPATASLMARQGPHLREWIAMQQKLAPTQKDIRAAQDMTDATGKLHAQYDLLASKLLTALTPALTTFANVLGTVVEGLAKWVEANPGWTEAISGFFAVLAAGKVIGAIRNILGLRSAILALGEANAGFCVTGGLLGFLAANPWIAAIITAGAVMNPGDLNGNEDERAREERYGQHGSGGGRENGNEMLRRRSRRGRQTYHDTTNYTGSNAEVLKQAAAQLGTSPHDLAMVMSYETAGTFSPKKWGGAKRSPDGHYAEAGHAGDFLGLIQFGHGERAMYGANDQQTFAQQMPAVVSYLKSRGFKPGMGLLDLYSTINAGRPGRYGASDGFGTVSSHVATMQAAHEGNVRRFLNSTSVPPVAPKPNPLWSGNPAVAAAIPGGGREGARYAASLNSISNDYRATTTSSSNEMHINGGIHVNAPNATDAHGIAGGIDGALARRLFDNPPANYGPY